MPFLERRGDIDKKETETMLDDSKTRKEDEFIVDTSTSFVRREAPSLEKAPSNHKLDSEVKDEENGFGGPEEGVLEKLEIAPMEVPMSVDKDYVKIVKDRLLKWKTLVTKGDCFMVKMVGHDFPFIIIGLYPNEGVIGHGTELIVLNELHRVERETVRVKMKEGDNYPSIFRTDQIVHSEEVEENGEKYLIIWIARIKKNYQIKFRV